MTTFQFAAPFFILRLAQRDFTDRKLNWQVLGGFSFSGSCPLLIQVMILFTEYRWDSHHASTFLTSGNIHTQLLAFLIPGLLH